jgi:predicted ferric reductase
VGRFNRYVLPVAILGINAITWSVSLALGPAGLPARKLIAEYLSTSAVLLMATNAMLSTRPRVLDRAFGGLDKLYVTHRTIGVIVALAIACHFALMPETPNSPVLPLAVTNLTLLLFSIALAIAPRSPWRRHVPLRYQNWKLEHRLMGLFLGLAVLHSVSAHPIMLSLPLERTWLYTMAALGLVAYVYRELAERFVKERHRYRVAETRHLADDVLEIALAPTAAPITHRAGQFAFVRFRGGPTNEQHPFTLSAAPEATGNLRFSIKASGDFTRELQHHLSAGSEARIEGAYGGFDWKRGGQRQLWLAGGIGITPFLAFLGDAEMDRDVRLIWSVRTKADAFYLEEISHAVAEKPNVRFELWESKSQGRLSLAALALERPAELTAFICGPVPARKAFAVQLEALGVPTREIRYEEFQLR